ncbi:MAG: globin, partial [Solirubrobacterales bacterium]|nr:globin [Solirubrobacterales bacterium]
MFGGPTRYTEQIGGYEHMLAKHHDLAITPEQRLRFASLMSVAAPAPSAMHRPRAIAGA